MNNINLLNAGYHKANVILHAGVSEDLKEKFDALFPTWTTVVATILALLILLLVLTKLLYKPIKKMHDDRRNYIQENIDAAEKQNKEAVSDREKANDELIQARLEVAEIIKKASEDAEQVRLQKIHLADAEARKVIADTKSNMLIQQAKFDEEKQEAIIEVALAAASKVIEKDADNETNRKIISEFAQGKKSSK